MKNNLRVLKLFVDNKDKTFTIKKAAEALHMNYKLAYEEVMRLEKEELIKITRHGNSNVCSFIYRFHPQTVAVEEIRKNELFRNKDIKLVFKRIKEINNPFYCLVLFGSYANKTAKKGSDIDLCLIADSQEINTEVRALLSITPTNVHLLDFTPKHFLTMLQSKEPNVGNEIAKNNIILYGLEAFYEMINHVKH